MRTSLPCGPNTRQKPTQKKRSDGTPPQKKKNSLRGLWDNIEHNNIRFIRGPERGEREQGIENPTEEIMTTNVSDPENETGIRAPEAQRGPHEKNPKRSTPGHVVLKLPGVKVQESIPKAAREEQAAAFEGAPVRPAADASAKPLRARGIGTNRAAR